MLTFKPSVFKTKFSELGVYLNHQIEKTKPNKIVLIADSNTEKECVPEVLNLVRNTETIIYSLPAGEEIKSLSNLEKALMFFTENNLNKNDLVLNVGGGVICDFGGFTASTYKRGIPFINIPTSLLAMVDASIGGKNGINLSNIKNAVGTFNSPIDNIICAEFLNTLPKTEINNGLAECLKHALIFKSSLWSQITTEPFDLEDILHQSALIKEQIVKVDLHENGLRKKLNFGHTIGHGFESFFANNNQPIPHGLAVVMGIICECYLSTQKTTLSKPELDEIVTYLKNNYSLPSVTTDQMPEIISYCKNDKKNTNQHFNFTLLHKIGVAEINFQLLEEDIYSALNFYTSI